MGKIEGFLSVNLSTWAVPGPAELTVTPPHLSSLSVPKTSVCRFKAPCVPAPRAPHRGFSCVPSRATHHTHKTQHTTQHNTTTHNTHTETERHRERQTETERDRQRREEERQDEEKKEEKMKREMKRNETKDPQNPPGRFFGRIIHGNICR